MLTIHSHNYGAHRNLPILHHASICDVVVNQWAHAYTPAERFWCQQQAFHRCLQSLNSFVICLSDSSTLLDLQLKMLYVALICVNTSCGTCVMVMVLCAGKHHIVARIRHSRQRFVFIVSTNNLFHIMFVYTCRHILEQAQGRCDYLNTNIVGHF